MLNEITVKNGNDIELGRRHLMQEIQDDCWKPVAVFAQPVWKTDLSFQNRCVVSHAPCLTLVHRLPFFISENQNDG
jgi:hypothetical protein